MVESLTQVDAAKTQTLEDFHPSKIAVLNGYSHTDPMLTDSVQFA